MDDKTLGAYDAGASGYADDWEAQPAPVDLQERVRRFFRVGGATADIGCGGGRDTAWLNGAGYPCVGYDPSLGMLAEARARHPDLTFLWDGLPELDSIRAGAFANVLCETVIMHLAPETIIPAVRRLIDILEPGGPCT